MTTLLVLAALLQGSAQAPAADTSVKVQGLLVRAPTGWLMALPAPLQLHDRSVTELELTGDTARWYGFNGHYVEVKGVLSGTVAGPRQRASFVPAEVHEVDPEGTARKTVSSSFAHRVGLVMYVLPRKIAWHNEAGQPSGVGPVIVYTMNNHGESDVTLEFESPDFMCFVVEPKDGGAPPWHWERRLQEPRDRQRVTLPKFVREIARVPMDAAPEPGTYIVRAGLCGFKEYELQTEIEVIR